MASRYYFLNNHVHVHVIKGSQTPICKPRIPKIIVGKRSNNTTPNTNPIRRRFITISPGDSKWGGNWDSEYKLSLHDLRLEDLVDDDHKKNAQVSVTLTVEKHASFGLSVDGRIITSFPRKCSTCSSTYCRKIDTEFNVWILPSRRVRCEDSLPEIGGEDPSVIYVKPGSEADLDSLVQDTIRITASIKDTCSEVCEKSPFTIQNKGALQTGSIDKRWSRLLELKKSQYS